MFPCIQQQDQAIRSTHSLGRSQNDGESVAEAVQIETLKDEVLKLKKKCKSLRYMVLELETRRSEEMIHFEQRLKSTEQQHETHLAEINAQHFIELAHAREHRLDELEELTNRHTALIEEYQHLHRSLEAKQQRITALERQLEQSIASKDTHQQAVDQLSTDFMTKMQDMAENRRTLEQQLAQAAQQILLLQHRCEEKICSQCSVYEERYQRIQREYEELQGSFNGRHDEINYLREENTRLERQIALIKADLDRAKNSPDYRTVLRSDRESRLVSEMNLAKAQVIELQALLQEMLAAKEEVEAAVLRVTEENERLNLQLHQLHAANDQLRSNHHSGKSGGLRS